jgi:IS30 family transposase
LAEQHPDDPEMQVSHETIYQSLFVQNRGALRKELHSCLRSGRAMRRAKAYTKGGVGQGQLRDMAEHVQFTLDTGVQIYFCPSAPSARATPSPARSTQDLDTPSAG